MAEVTVPAFIAKWSASRRTERAAAQEHFIDLCRLLGEQTPNEADPTGEDYAFEKGATKTSGGQGWADVWKRGRFAWEYKGKHANLRAAYQQLLQYREDLDNPPLLVVCDLDRFEVHTNFTGTAKQVYAFDLADLAAPTATGTSALPPLDVLRAVFTQPERLRPERTAEYVTEQAAAEFATLAESLRQRGVDPERAAHFLMRLLFCLFAEDIDLLPRRLFTRLVEQTRRRPAAFQAVLRDLFAKMKGGGFFGADEIAYFNGGLFADDTPGLHPQSPQRSVQPWRSDDETLEVTTADLAVLERAARLDWASVEPAIFGTLFERSLDPDKRSQLGAHYTSREDILLIVEPVLIAPLRRRWAAVREQAEELIARRDAASGGARTRREQRELERLLMDFAGEIAAYPRARPGVRQRQLPVRGAEAAARPGEGGQPVCGAARAAVGAAAAGAAGPALRDRGQHLRARAGVGGGVDRVHPVAARKRVRDSRQADSQAVGQHPAHGRRARRRCRGAAGGTGVAGGGHHHRQSAVPGGQADAVRAGRRVRGPAVAGCMTGACRVKPTW